MAGQSLVRQLGRKIRELRTRAGLTQEQLAARSGITWHYTSAIERGTRGATLETLAAIAEALNVSLSELFVGVGRPLPRELKRLDAALAGLSPEEQQTILELVEVALRLKTSR